MAIIIATLVIDTSIIRVIPFYLTYSDIPIRTKIFLCIFMVFVAAETVILYHSYRSSVTPVNRLELAIVRSAVYFSQCILSILLSFVVGQIFFMGKFHTNLLTIIASISYVFSSGIFVMLTCNFWLWYLSRRNLVILSYALCCLRSDLQLRDKYNICRYSPGETTRCSVSSIRII